MKNRSKSNPFKVSEFYGLIPFLLWGLAVTGLFIWFTLNANTLIGSEQTASSPRTGVNMFRHSNSHK